MSRLALWWIEYLGFFYSSSSGFGVSSHPPPPLSLSSFSLRIDSTQTILYRWNLDETKPPCCSKFTFPLTFWLRLSWIRGVFSSFSFRPALDQHMPYYFVFPRWDVFQGGSWWNTWIRPRKTFSFIFKWRFMNFNFKIYHVCFVKVSMYNMTIIVLLFPWMRVSILSMQLKFRA